MSIMKKVKIRKHKIVSALLIFILVCGLAPSATLVSAGTPLAGELVKYEFKLSASYPMGTKYDSTNNTWEYAGNTEGWTPPTGTNGCKALADSVQINFEEAGNWIALELNVPASGRYHADMVYRVARGGGVVEMFLMPVTGNIEEGLTHGYYIGEVDYYNATAAFPHEVKLDDIEIPLPGKYLLVFRLKESAGKVYMYPATFTINGTELEAVTLSLDESRIGVGELTGAHIAGEQTGGGISDLSTATIKYTSRDESIAVVDENGKITALSEGETDIAVAVVKDGVTKTDSCRLTVDDSYAFESVILYAENTLTTVSSSRLFVSGKLKNGNTANLSRSDTVFTVVESDPAGAATISEGIIYGHLAGSVDVKATVSFRGKAVESNILNILISEPGDTLGVVGYDYKVSGDIRYLPEYESSRKWAYFADTVTDPETDIAIKGISSGMQIQSLINEWVALKMQFPETGNYRAVLSYLGARGGGKANIYLLPKTEQISQDIESNLTDYYLIGQVSNYASPAASFETELKDVYIHNSGEYLVVFKAAEKGPYNTYMYPIGLDFKGMQSLDEVSLLLDNDKLEFGQTMRARFSAKLLDGGVFTSADDTVKVFYKSSNPMIASVDNSGLITAKKPGVAEIGLTITRNDVKKTDYKSITVTDSSEAVSVELTGVSCVWAGGTEQLNLTATLASGNIIDLPADIIKYTVLSCEPEGAATLSETGLITGVSEGIIIIKAAAVFGDKTVESRPITLPVLTSSKTEPTVYTYEKREIVKENAKSYSWAKRQVDSAVNEANKYIDKVEVLYDLIVAEGLPRYYYVGSRYDPEKCTCRYCGADLLYKYGYYPWLIDALNTPWKIQCPECKRRFPSNDFGDFYKLGLDGRGIFNLELAREKNDGLIAGGEKGYLVNKLYPEKDEHTDDDGVVLNEGVNGWGVDDGFGYFPGHTYSDGTVERHNYIAYFLHEGLWHAGGIIMKTLGSFANAYVYTGEVKYGRAGAILLDRIADFYPDYDWYQWRTFRNDNYKGKILDNTWGASNATNLAAAYDAFFPVYEDKRLIAFLNDKANKYKLSNQKNSASDIRKNAEDRILREIFASCVNFDIEGNFGMMQQTLAMAAVTLDTMPETKEWIDWMMRPDTSAQSGVNPMARTGGDVLTQLVNVIDRDGMGNEAAPGYNLGWLGNILAAAEILSGYEKYQAADLYENPKFVKMFTAHIPLVLASYYTAQIGDSGSTAGSDIVLAERYARIGYNRLQIPQFAQLLFMINGQKAEGLHDDIMTRDPERIQDAVLDAVKTYGSMISGSTMMTGYGFAVLRDGARYGAADKSGVINTQRDFYIYFGRGGGGHGHRDNLNLGIDAYGLNMAPDLGYPEQTGQQPNRLQWVSQSLSHNTVTVNGKTQKAVLIHGYPKHFDDSGRVKVMDIDTPHATAVTSIYRRTLVMVEANDEVSYGVDFFRVAGGDDHIYSFHSQSDEIFETEGLDLLPQVDENGDFTGSYAGPKVPWGPDPKTTETWSESSLEYGTGFTWLDEVSRDKKPGPVYAVDFKVKDFNNILPYNRNLHLRMTMMVSEPLDEVAIANGYPPQRAENNKIPNLKYVLARRSGEKLDSLFTTIYEPYCDNRYLKSIEGVTAKAIEGEEDPADVVKAVKVTHKNDRVDYIVYATNNRVKYEIDRAFNFRGFVGVYTMQGDAPIYTYLNDGDIIGDNAGNLSAVTGYVEDYTRILQMDNSIIINPAQQIDPKSLEGKYIYIDNSDESSENGVYKILGARVLEESRVLLDIGDVTLIRQYRNDLETGEGFVYNIEAGQEFRIPLSSAYDVSPIFKQSSDITIEVNSEFRMTVDAESPIGKALTYQATTLPRGAHFDPGKRLLIWVPDSRQMGKHYAGIEASDGALSTTKYFQIIVLSGTTPKKDNMAQPVNAEPGLSKPPDEADSGVIPNRSPEPDSPQTPKPQERFRDLDGFDWAKEAITALADAGIVNGVGADFYAPTLKISRADFALLLVRALMLTSSYTESFADVPPDAYYQNELAIAKANGIVTGVGGDRYNPDANISRQDVMVILYRALLKTGYDLDDADESTLLSFGDKEELADYAKTAVDVLIKNGIVVGSDGKIDPKGTITRAESAVLIHRILKNKTDVLKGEGSE